MKLPTKQECYNLLKKYKAPQNIIKHLEAVTRVAVAIGKALQEKGEDVDSDVLERAGLLHDLVKFIDFDNYDRFSDPEVVDFYEEIKKKYGQHNHVKASAELVAEEGYPELSKVMERHGFMCIDTEEGPKTWEQKILNYADKRVKHSTIVSLKDRFEDLHKRYGPQNTPDYDVDLRDDKEKAFFALEEELFSKIDLKPGDLND
ncbi:MAG: HD domain-containing protein [Candidatus Woesearchaeota archaeon]|jgi:putative nucleotidyltransferase with HDIG domain|nr:HD domain-containing protein [Candidatus Woesearchaeota archaeon]MDP7324434.1 HD domain-containing protein [Candidatus Woesearchaeota archaeon]MDP7457719.1 HD domain-containing protein [Candidatus Woesearchaeota archaeon]|tara:strand:- start:337 stop:945 length:609 start_codon:yes stop_codon:yes gene_type:complete